MLIGLKTNLDTNGLCFSTKKKIKTDSSLLLEKTKNRAFELRLSFLLGIGPWSAPPRRPWYLCFGRPRKIQDEINRGEKRRDETIQQIQNYTTLDNSNKIRREGTRRDET
jgi:hypothetical protein